MEITLLGRKFAVNRKHMDDYFGKADFMARVIDIDKGQTNHEAFVTLLHEIIEGVLVLNSNRYFSHEQNEPLFIFRHKDIDTLAEHIAQIIPEEVKDSVIQNIPTRG